ncbi:hypothetical protein DFH06DRAFT_1228491 [Mycena polygramma]|nr:hypothetical protein DFH06DRAFT_1228491 [Mycena polygramma]
MSAPAANPRILGPYPVKLPWDPESLPPVWNSRNGLPLYGLGWETSEKEICAKFDTKLCMASIPPSIIMPRWAAFEDRFSSQVRFKPHFTATSANGPLNDGDHMLCFIAFNDAIDMRTLKGPDAQEFIKAAKEVMKITEDEEKTFMWYKCSTRPSFRNLTP